MSDEAYGWAGVEMANINLGDRRLNRRAIRILDSLASNPQGSIPETHRDWSETYAAYRFLDNDKVTPSALLAPHHRETVARMKSHQVVLAVADTSSLNYKGLKATEGLGAIGDSKNQDAKGLLMHTTYAVSEAGLPLGCLDQFIYSRSSKSKYKTSQKRAKTDISKKESFRWLTSMERVSKLTSELPDTTVIHVMDREADIYELFCETQSHEQNFIIRARHNRLINKTSRRSTDGELLFSALSKSPSLGTVELELKSNGGGDSTRVATVELRAINFNLTAPEIKSPKVHKFKQQSIRMTAVRVCEIDLDEGTEDPIDWLLLTNVSINSADEVLQCVSYYCLRWQIEVFHRILKTGCRVEDCKFGSAKKIAVYVALMTIVAWRIHWLTLLARLAPNATPDLAFTKKEQNILIQLVIRRKAPDKEPSNLSDFVRLLARLGGYLARKNDGPPGAEVLWRGWIKLNDFTRNLLIIEQNAGASYV